MPLRADMTQRLSIKGIIASLCVMAVLLVIAGLYVTSDDRSVLLPAHSDFAYRSRTGIPLLLHMTWKTPNVPAHFQPYLASWIRNNPHWKYAYWTDESARTLVAYKFVNLSSMEQNQRFVSPLTHLHTYLDIHSTSRSSIHTPRAYIAPTSFATAF